VSHPRRFERWIDRAFVRELSPRKRRLLREHLASCESCRERWQRLALVDRRLGGPVLPDAVREAIEEAVVPHPARRRVAWAFSGGLAIAAVAAVLLVIRSPNTDTLQPRGSGEGGRTPGLRLFCVAHNGAHVVAEARAVSEGPAPSLRCTIGADLQLAYTTPNLEGLTMIVFGHRDRTILHYAPSAPGVTILLQRDRVDELVEWSTPLAARHDMGDYDVVVRFFDRPIATPAAIAGHVPAVVELRARLEVVGDAP
jgi:hypothetical protein